MTIPQTVFRPYRVVENAPLAQGMFCVTIEAEQQEDPLPPFQAGQWVNVRLLNANGGEWAKAAYSIANAPTSGTQRIELGIKREGAFTERLQALRPGDRVEVQGPWGIFVLNPTRGHHVCIAGGIGVTPFVSMAREAAETGQAVTVLYSTRTAAEAAYLNELQALAAAHTNITLLCTCTRGCSENWEGEEGRITDALMRRVLANDACYLLCGPNDFMKEMRSLLIAQGIDTKQIAQESFG